MDEKERIVKREVLYDEIQKWANEVLQYNAEDKIDDFVVYTSELDPDYKIIRVMSPVGQELYFKVEPLRTLRFYDSFYVKLLLDTWERNTEKLNT